ICAIEEFFGKIIRPSAGIFEPVEFSDDEDPLPYMPLQAGVHKPKIVKRAEGHSFSRRGIRCEKTGAGFSPITGTWMAGAEYLQLELAVLSEWNCPRNALCRAVCVQPRAKQRLWSNQLVRFHALIQPHAFQRLHVSPFLEIR